MIAFSQSSLSNVQAPGGEGEGAGGGASGSAEPGGRVGGGERPREEAAPDGNRGQEQAEAGDIAADGGEHGAIRRQPVNRVDGNASVTEHQWYHMSTRTFFLW